ncbi:glycoside hydrolase family 19 protein [Rhizobium sp. LC145]|uniref:glycoside hydrolase family 19 protein n=1 Tax=Rhizobium sp. LC145 TaxID=1120688 RepID=UPI000629DDAA|nr:glycoside hydrolase family 19 protein [Rhizobium sp. LC145]KKX24301.1 chitinase [Rhizobium sp. LC145]TKT46170.1 glycoside hydrolase family 19 protein [Rhizobiaceae bacterium LC148]
MITAAQVRAAAKVRVVESNLSSVLIALQRFGPAVGLNLPHREVPYLAQLMHESGSFRFDREIWGPTPAQERYDTRADLGNTPQKDGDGKKFMGRTGGQITGRANYAAFRDWCAEKGMNPPDFVKNPELLNTDPWEGLGPIWYWDVGNPDRKSLNRYADRNDQEMITRRWNGGLNGYPDRLDYYTRLGLVYLGYKATEILAFQKAAKAAGKYRGNLDGLDGPQTRAAIHLMLADLAPKAIGPAIVSPAPVTEEKPVPVPVTPPSLDAPWWKSKEVLVPAVTGTGLSSALSAIGGMPWQNLLLVLLAVAGISGFLYWRKSADRKAVAKTVEGMA